MKPIEAYADKKHCELCGAVVLDGLPDRPDRTGAEVIRRLAFIADTSPSIAILMIHHIAGRTEREIAKRLKVSPAAAHGRIVRAKKRMLALCNNK